jgi:hypothetical protein
MGLKKQIIALYTTRRNNKRIRQKRRKSIIICSIYRFENHFRFPRQEESMEIPEGKEVSEKLVRAFKEAYKEPKIAKENGECTKDLRLRQGCSTLFAAFIGDLKQVLINAQVRRVMVNRKS